MRMDKKIHDKDIKSRIRERIAGKVDMQLGKSGITNSFLRELKFRLEKHGVVKLRVLKSFRNTYTNEVDHLASLLAERTGSRVYEIRGFTIILIKDKNLWNR